MSEVKDANEANEVKEAKEAKEAKEERDEEGLQMSFLDHLDELRVRIIRAVLAIAVAFAVCFFFAKPIYKFLSVPVVQQLQKAHLAGQLKNGQINPALVNEGEIVQYTLPQDTAVNGVKVPQGAPVLLKKIIKDNQPVLVLAQPWVVGGTRVASETPLNQIIQAGESTLFYDDKANQLVVRGVTSPFMIYVQVGLYAGLALAIPFLILQVWAFISPGLYKHEKQYITPVLLLATVFFIVGATFAYKIAFPAACDYLLGLAVDGGFQTLLDAEEYLSLIIMIMLGSGIVFQIPTLAFLLGRVGLITPRMMLKVWRHAIIVIAIIAAVLTPTPDMFNMMMMAGPMIGLYFISIGIVWLFGKPRVREAEVTALAHSDS